LIRRRSSAEIVTFWARSASAKPLTLCCPIFVRRHTRKRADGKARRRCATAVAASAGLPSSFVLGSVAYQELYVWQPHKCG
jgi:hypothetical protein